MKISRRDILKFAVGSAAGMMLTPVPWKVLDDSAIWTQNWPWIPVPLKGESTTRFTTCTLCPAGCGMKARCIGGQPVSLSGVSDHPLSYGALCPIGLGAHHLAYHSSRVLSPVRRSMRFGTAESRQLSLDEAAGAVAGAIRSSAAGESVAILDQQPGRSISLFYRRLSAQLPRGVYLRAPMIEDATLAACTSMLGMRENSLGFDLENARTVLSFGAPLFDGWGTPGRIMQLAESRRKNGHPTILQIETRQSRTALQADVWVPIKPGTEGAFALGLAHVLVTEGLCNVSRLRSAASDFERHDGSSFTEVVSRFTPETVSRITGVNEDHIRDIARKIAQETPTVVLGAGDPAGGPLRPEENLAIASLNILLGSVGQKGGIVARRALPSPTGDQAEIASAHQIQDVPDRSIRVLLLDGAEAGHALPWALIERKLADEKALVVSFSPYLAGLSRHAEIIIPSPVFLESLQDVPTPFHSGVETFSLAAPLLTPPPGATEPLDAMRKIAEVLGVAADALGVSASEDLKARVQAIHSSGRGSIFTATDKKTVPVKELDSADKLWSALMEGGCWMDDAAGSTPLPRISFLAKSGVTAQQLQILAEGQQRQSDTGTTLTLMPYGWRGTAGSGQLSPLMSKVYQESGLRSVSNIALVNPESGKALGVQDHDTATIQTPAGSVQVLVRYDSSVIPGVLHVAVGPDGAAINSASTGEPSGILSLCLAEDGRSWRVASAKMSKLTV